MSLDHHPIPLEALPPGWGPAECDDGTFAYRCTRPPIELVADCTDAGGFHPGLGLGRCWELRYRYSMESQSITERIGRVSTRRAAVNGLLECMSCIHDTVEELSDPIEIEAALERVSLDHCLPESRRPALR
jgi:hypothetical protein